MANPIREFGVVGLGRMGSNLALQAIEKGFRVVGFDAFRVPEETKRAGLVDASSLQNFKQLLSRPRAVFLYIPAGPPVDRLLDDFSALLDPGDILVDGGNSYWGDSIRRYRRMHEKGIHLGVMYFTRNLW